MVQTHPVRSIAKAITKSTSIPIDCQKQCSTNKKVYRKLIFVSKCRTTFKNSWRKRLV